MHLQRIEITALFASLIFALSGVVFFMGGVAHADANGQNISNGVFNNLCQVGVGIFAACDHGSDTGSGGGSNGNSNPVSPTPELPAGSSAQEINCDIYAHLLAAGQPIPSGFDASHCGGNSGGGNGGGGGGSGGTDACPNETTDPGVQTSGPCNADDVCPAMDGVQTDPTQCTTGGGGGGGSTTGAATGGDGGGGGAYVASATTTSEGGDVLGSATSTSASCDMYLTGFIKPGAKNDPEQVTRLQHVLKTIEGANVEENGSYDTATITAVNAFQMKYASEILAPWNIAKSTGYVYLTTRKKINEVNCDHGVQFPLTPEETMLIEKVKAAHVVEIKPAVAKPAAPTETKIKEPAVVAPAETNTGTSPVSSPIRDFFRRLFNRGR